MSLFENSCFLAIFAKIEVYRKKVSLWQNWIKFVIFLKMKKTFAIISDPVTIHYLTGFYSDPHERQMFLFVFTDQNLYFLFPL